MRLLQVVPAYTSYDAFLRELAEAAVKAGHSSAVVCGAVPEGIEDSERGVRIFRLRMPRGAQPVAHWAASRTLRGIIEAWRPDVVHAHFSAGMFTTALALRRSDRSISFGTFHGLSFPLSREPKRSIVRAGEVFAARRFDRVLVLTADDQNALRKAASAVPVETQPGCGVGCRDRFVDTPRLSGEERRAQRRARAIADEARVLIFVGRLVAFKGFDLAVRTFWQVRRAIPDVRLMVVGNLDPLHPTGLSPREWHRYEQDPDIIRAGHQDDVMPWLDLADLMLFPSEREGLPVCVMEALARGLPVAAAPVRGSRELVFEGRNGFLISTRSELVWAERLVTLLRESRYLLPAGGPDSREAFRRSRWVRHSLDTYLGTLTPKGSPLASSGAARPAHAHLNRRLDVS